MPRYFFHSQTGARFTDTKGCECDDDLAACQEAVRLLGELVRDAPVEFGRTRPWTVTVKDAADSLLYEFSMAGAASAMTAGDLPPGGRR